MQNTFIFLRMSVCITKLVTFTLMYNVESPFITLRVWPVKPGVCVCVCLVVFRQSDQCYLCSYLR